MKELQKKVVNITLKGEVEVRGKFIKHLEGGFGEDCKIISDLDIASQHDVTTSDIRKLINRNISRFKENIDYIDLKNCPSCDDQQLESFGYSKMQQSKANNIYILSERGYSKVIKIMDTDLAWEIYDDLLDGYFILREKVKKQLSTLEELRMHYQVLEQQSQEIQEVKADVADLKENMPLFNIDCKELQELVRKKGIESLGGYKSQAYNDKSLRSKVYSDIQNQLRREFGVNKYERIKHSQLELAKQIVNTYKIPVVLLEQVQALNNQTSLLNE